MRARVFAGCPFICFLLWACIPAVGACAENEHTDEFWQQQLQPFLEQYCYDCHSGDGAEADIDFAKYDAATLLESERPRWNQVRGMIEIGAMPPVDYDPQPSREQRELIADWIDRRVNTVDCGVVNDPGRVTMRRLNSAEYDNTLRDLLGIDFSPSKLVGFPSDGVGNGFDNQGDVLTLSPLQLEKYLQAAEQVTSHIIVHDVKTLREQEKPVPALYRSDQRSVSFNFADGEYEIRARMEFQQDGKETVPVALLVDGSEIKRWDVGDKRTTYAIDHKFKSGTHELTLHYVTDPGSEEKNYRRRVDVEHLTIVGPRGGTPAMPEPHRRLFVAMPDEKNTVAEAARKIFEPLIRRAFRRQPKPVEIDRTVELVKMATEQGESFENAVALGLHSVLVSPHFLFRVENESVESGDDAEHIADYAFASRLSYFLWASMPDDELLELAGDGKLRNPQVVKAQVSRMLADAKSEALVKRFFGQFLGLGGLNESDPDPNQFPQWNAALRRAVQQETELVCQDIVQKDLSLNVLLNGDFTYINPRLAELYGIDFDGQDPKELYEQGPGYRRSSSSRQRDMDYLDEDRWIRVALPKDRRGILTHASVLTLTSNPTSTSPVKRGKWILENLLGDPPPPAPPNVPNFDETKKEHGNLSLRQQLEIHRSNPSCASCHRVMDPLGLGFENFDAIGQWRDRDGKHPIDAAGELADGRKFNGAAELVALLNSRQQEIHRHFCSKLLTYALGRGLEPYDNCAIDEIMEQAQAQDFRMSAFVQAIVASQPFTQRRVNTSDHE